MRPATFDHVGGSDYSHDSGCRAPQMPRRWKAAPRENVSCVEVCSVSEMAMEEFEVF
jgi:hypothetical protein